MNNTKIKKLRTVNLNERGQMVIPEDIRNDLGLKGPLTLVIIKKDDELIIKKELDVLTTMEYEDKFWKYFSIEAMKKAWSKEDEIWDKIFKESK